MSQYVEMLSEIGFTEDQVQFETNLEIDRYDIDLHNLGIEVKESNIHGLGMFAERTLFAEDPIGPMNMEGLRTQLGRYVNHSDTPNAYPYFVEGGILLIAKEDIKAGCEITVDYREMVRSREAESITVDKIFNAEQFLASLPQTEVEPGHVFGDGTYARTILIPRGNWITGKPHKFNDINIVVYGSMLVAGGYLGSDDPIEFKQVHGPLQFVGKAGMKKIGYALEDTLWITIHATPTDDLDTIERECFIEVEGEPKVLDFKTGEQIKGVLK